MLTVPILESSRLILKKLSLEFCTDAYLTWMNDKDVYKYLETGGNYSMDDLRSYLKEVESKKELFFWAITIKDSGQHIGNIKVDPINLKHGFGEYGIMMGEKGSWGLGYAYEASECVINYCFQILGLRKINLGVVVDNLAAVNLYRKLGFSVEGHYKYHALYDGRYCDTYRMAVFSPEFLSKMNETR